jgi:hypothetical protein
MSRKINEGLLGKYEQLWQGAGGHVVKFRRKTYQRGIPHGIRPDPRRDPTEQELGIGSLHATETL